MECAVSHVDALTLAAVVDELRATIIDGRIQRVLQPSPLSVALEIYAGHRRHQLLISAHPRFARIHLSSAKPSRGVSSETPLLLLLRKYVNGGRILAVEQPSLERVILLSIVKRPSPRNSGELEDEPPPDMELDDLGESDDLLRCELVAELMDQRSNIVLVGDDNSILAAARRVTAQMSRRVVLPREPYELPPPQEKRDPRQITAEGAAAAAADAQPDAKGRAATIARALVGAYRGLSPLAAREAVFRAMGDAEAQPGPLVAWDRVAACVRALWAGTREPCLAIRGGEPVAFAPYALTHLPGLTPQPSTSAALEAFFSAKERLTDHQQRRDALRAQILDLRGRVDRQRAALEGELEQARGLERLRWEGEMIFAYLHTIAPRQAELRVADEQGAQHVIRLDPDRSAVEAAQARFRAYDKAKSAIEGVPERLREAELRLAGIDETLAFLAVAEGFEAIETIAIEAAEQGYLPNRQPSGKRRAARPKAMPLRLESSDGLPLYVGRSAGQNEMVTFKLGAPDDLWLHARGMPGAHVIIKSAGRAIPDQTLAEAAGLAAYFSQAREEHAVEVDYARRSQVRRIKGGPPGLVSYHAEGTLRAQPQAPWK
jgi:predicted ribosome quality control (RQC) complex YloA/Tae2 family protein